MKAKKPKNMLEEIQGMFKDSSKRLTTIEEKVDVIQSIISAYRFAFAKMDVSTRDKILSELPPAIGDIIKEDLKTVYKIGK